MGVVFMFIDASYPICILLNMQIISDTHIFHKIYIVVEEIFCHLAEATLLDAD